MMRILIIKTTSLGDVVHNLPIIADIKKHFPDALIDWVVEESFTDIITMHPAINQVIPVAIRRWRKALFSKQVWREMLAFRRQLQAQQYDVVIDSQGLLKSALITYLSHSYNKCGYDKASARESIASFFYDHQFAIAPVLHAVVRNRQLAALVLGYKIDEALLEYGIHVTPTNDLDPGITVLPSSFILALHGTSRDSKLWPTAHWVTLGRKLQLQNISLVLPWGNNAELQRAQQIASQLQHALVLPKIGIAGLAKIIEASQAVIGVDTGLAHLAVAFNKPVIAIYTDTDPSLTGLYGSTAQACINLGGQHLNTSPQQVFDQLQALEIVSHEST